MKANSYRVIPALVMAMAALVLLSSCTSTSQMRKVKASGFLSDYSKMTKGWDGRAQLVYINPNVNWMAYNRVMIDPITVYAIPGNPLDKLPREQLIALANYLDSALRDELGKSYTIVDEPGSGVMRLRVALTEAGAGRPVLGVVSSLTPPGLALAALKKVATGQATATGSARIEMELVDPQDGSRLAAAVDAQAGNKRDFFGNFNKWDDAQDAFDNWSAQLSRRLLELRVGRQ